MPDTWKAVWAQLADPANLRAKVKDMAAAADVSLTTWWRVTRDPEFVTLQRRALYAACGAQLGRVLNCLVNSALILGREGEADRRLLLEMLGLYEPGMAAARERARGDKEAATVARLSDDALLEMARDLGLAVPPGVARRLAARAEPDD